MAGDQLHRVTGQLVFARFFLVPFALYRDWTLCVDIQIVTADQQDDRKRNLTVSVWWLEEL
jgi:hypothetical protein